MERKMMPAELGKPSPDPIISECVQGNPSDFVIEKGKVTLIEVFQVNFPWCFIFGIPEAIQIHQNYSKYGVNILGLATAFEDFQINTPDNLKLLVNEQKVVGNTYKKLRQFGKLDKDDKLPYKIPFPVAMDKINTNYKETDHALQCNDDSCSLDTAYTQEKKSANKKEEIHNTAFDNKSSSDVTIESLMQHTQNADYFPCTFEMFGLSGTPSSIIIDSDGVLQHVVLGNPGTALARIKEMLE